MFGRTVDLYNALHLPKAKEITKMEPVKRAELG